MIHHPHADHRREIRRPTSLSEDELFVAAKELQAPRRPGGRGGPGGQGLPVTLFTAGGGIATPADAAMMMQPGARGRVRRLGIFCPETPSSGCGDREGHHLLRRPRRAGQDSRGLGERPWSASSHRVDIPSRTAWRHAAGKRHPWPSRWRSSRSSTSNSFRGQYLPRGRL